MDTNVPEMGNFPGFTPLRHTHPMTSVPHAQDITHDDAALLTLLRDQVRTIAVVGASIHAWRAAHGVMRYCQGQGYRCLPVNPSHETVLSEPCVPSLADLPEPAELIDVFRNLEALPGLIREILVLPWRPAAVWLQEGLAHPDVHLLHAAGIATVQDRCLFKEHWRLIGFHRPAPAAAAD